MNSVTRSRRFASVCRRSLFGIPAEEASFARRGFYSSDPEVRERLEAVGFTFLGGYHAALEHPEPGSLSDALDEVDLPLRGFAYEGAAMALALLDLLTPWKRDRLARFQRDAGDAHIYMLHVGAGWTLARFRRRLSAPPQGMDPLLGWLSLDGYGFHEGYFHPVRTVEQRRVPRRIAGYARRVFDQGVGRSLWFIHGADVERVAATVSAFPSDRRSDLWSGVGLACTYAGGAHPAALRALAQGAGEHRPALAQGAAFAAKARERAGNPTPHTEAACRALCGISALEAAAITDEALRDLHPTASEPAYAVWKLRIQSCFVFQPVSP